MGGVYCGVFFCEDFWWIWVADRVGLFLVVFMERRADFLRPMAAVRSVRLGFLVGRWRNWRRS